MSAGVVGHPVGHSLSPAIHNAAFAALGIDAAYSALDAPEPEDALAIMQRIHDPLTLGFNVTMPHKRVAFDFADEVDEVARDVAGVNTLVLRGGRAFGANTDPAGFVYALGSAPVEGAAAVVLGTGPTAASAVRALASIGAGSITILSRNPRPGIHASMLRAAGEGWSGVMNVAGYDDSARVVGASSVLIDTTPLGMRAGDPCAIDTDCLHADLVVVDAVYGADEPTALLVAAERMGVHASDGLKLLVGQAARSFEMFTGIDAGTAPIDIMLAAAEAELERRRR